MSDGAKIAMICADYAPKPGPGATRMTAFAKGLAERGCSPHVLTSGTIPGKLGAHWREVKQPLEAEEETWDFAGGRGRTQALGAKMINLLVPTEPSVMLSLRSLRRTFAELARRAQPDVIYVTCNPLASAVGGVMLKRLHGLPLIVEFRDPWTQNPVRNWPTYFHYMAESRLEHRVLKQADAVIMNTPLARANLLDKYSWLDANKVHAISHGFDGDMAVNPAGDHRRRLEGQQATIRIAYLGGFYMPLKPARRGVLGSLVAPIKSALSYSVSSGSPHTNQSSPESLLRAIARYNTAADADGPRLQIDFIGGEHKQLADLIARLQLSEYVRITPRVESGRVREVLRGYDLLYLTNPPVHNSPFIGTKTFDYLASGQPIVAELPQGDQAALICRSRAGWITDHASALEDFSRLLAKLAATNNTWRRELAPDRQFIELFARRHQVSDVHHVLQQVVGRRSAQPVISEGYRQLGA